MTADVETLELFCTEVDRALDKAELRELRRMVFPPKPDRHFGRCVFCGRRCWGRACHAHRDLIQLDATG